MQWKFGGSSAHSCITVQSRILVVLAGVEGAVGASASKVQEEKGSAQPKDFVATIDATEGSPCFGQIISEADAPTSGNEPHHVGLNQDSTVRWQAAGNRG